MIGLRSDKNNLLQTMPCSELGKLFIITSMTELLFSPSLAFRATNSISEGWIIHIFTDALKIDVQ